MIRFIPGDHFSYSGEGFVYLQTVVARIEHKPLNQIMEELVFRPLRMPSSSYVWRPDFDLTTAIGHNAQGAEEPKQKPLVAKSAATLQTTANDYARFLAELLSGQGISRRVLAEMETPATKVSENCIVNCFDSPASYSSRIFWGLGVGLEKTDDDFAIWHWGDNGDFKAYMVGYPKLRSGMVMLTNSANGLSIANAIAKITLGSDQPALGWLKNP